MAEPRYRIYLFQDGVICGVIGGAVAWLMGAPIALWGLLSVLAGPLSILAITIALDQLPFAVPGRGAGAHEFAVYAAIVAVAITVWRMAGG